MARRPALLLALIIAVSALGASGMAGPSPVIAAETPPACTYDDVLTRYRAYSDWDRTLLDTKYMLGSGYAPNDLVAVSNAGLSGGGSVRRLVIKDLTALVKAARAAGARVQSASAYRSYATQRSTFSYWVSVEGYKKALLSSARPGHSEHQLGLTIDFTSYGGSDPWTYTDWATTKAGAWMAKNAWKYGFIMSYPEGKSPSKTCYKYEPWHYRYFGAARAKAIHDSGLSSREWLWNQGAITGWKGVTPTPTPAPTPAPFVDGGPTRSVPPRSTPVP